MIPPIVNFVNRDQLQGLSMSKNFFIRVRVYSEPTLVWFDSGGIQNVMSQAMMENSNFQMSPTKRRIQVEADSPNSVSVH